jgi:2-dehydro-3-deoxyphosphogluconate aldolase/(4S)-4-hydroxy-2-oxoglutarate aldolase
MNRDAICRHIEELGIVPVIRAPSPALALAAATALGAGGLDVLEITMTVPDALSVLRQLASSHGEQRCVGAGTVLDAATARACIEAGAQFIVSPGFDREMIGEVHRLQRPVFAGALTPSEIIEAWKAGADIVKVFPCSALGGAKYLKALRAPLPQIKLMPTGGVNLSTVGEFIDAGAVALGVGAELVDIQALQAGAPEVLTQRASEYLQAVKRARASKP